jgi:hypothetical protein
VVQFRFARKINEDGIGVGEYDQSVQDIMTASSSASGSQQGMMLLGNDANDDYELEEKDEEPKDEDQQLSFVFGEGDLGLDLGAFWPIEGRDDEDPKCNNLSVVLMCIEGKQAERLQVLEYPYWLNIVC